ncbi:MAG: hypothetical protein KatS3mg110_2207 [Pirellulaceae bacterium]|nr:MAG: hypothetical protein KatS3mg110_2207 [Pirellulaceae bacterium]
MSGASVLQELVRQVRTDTLRILESVPDAALLWAPPGTSNTILWHAGHALWLQDLMCVALLAGESHLPEGWAERFGQGSRPSQITQWPSRAEVVQLLGRQLVEIGRLLENATEEELAGYPTSLSHHRNVLGWIVHGLHDEAKHCGEMYLLWKMWSRSRKLA